MQENFSKAGGDFQMVQLWVNLPAKDKKSPPKYQALVNADISKVNLPDDAGLVEVIAGEYQGAPGSASTFTPMHLLNAKLNKGGAAGFEFPANYNTALLVIEGNITVNGDEKVPVDNFALFENKGETFQIVANENSLVLVLSGEPINEPIAAHGPFVMNTRQELVQAFEEFNAGKFGHLED